MDDFIFTPSVWLGQGKITLTSSPEFIKFYTKWFISQKEDGSIIATQNVELDGVEEPVTNIYTITKTTPAAFSITLESDSIERVSGTGFRNDQRIGWEFIGQQNIEGFEVFEKQENGDFFFHAEFGNSENFRTIIEGLIWRKEAQ